MPRRVRRSLLRGRAVRSLPLAPSSVPLIPSRQCTAFIEKSELATGGSLPYPFSLLFLFVRRQPRPRPPRLPTSGVVIG